MIGLRLRHRLVGGAARPEAVAVLAERRVPQRLKLLQNRLLDHAIDRGWNAKVARPAGRLRDGYPMHRLRLVAPLEQLSFDFRPARLENSGPLFDGDPVNARRSLVAHHRSQSCFYVVWGTDRLHEMVGGRRAFGFGRRRDRFDLLPARTRGFTPAGERQVQLELGWRSRCGHETSERVALSFTPLRGPFGPSAGAPAYYALCRLLHRAQGASRLPQSRGTRCRSPGVSPAAFLAHPPDLQFWSLMDRDFATSCPLVRPALPHIRFLFVGSRFCSTLPSDGPSRFRPCASLVLHLHQVAQGTFTPRLLDMPSPQAGRAGDRPPARARAVHDLPRAAPQRRHAQRWSGVSGHDRAMARPPLRPPSQVGPAGDKRAVAALRAGPARRSHHRPERGGGARARRAVDGPPARASAGPALGHSLEPRTDRPPLAARLP